MFIHFEPTGPIDGQVEYNGDLPPYVIAGSEEEEYWRDSNPNGHKIMPSSEFATGSTEAHRYANQGDIRNLKRVLDKQADAVNIRDANGWTPLHEAVRTGDLELIELLIDRGAEVNARTGLRGEGGGALDWAQATYGSGHAIADFIESRGGKFFLGERDEL